MKLNQITHYTKILKKEWGIDRSFGFMYAIQRQRLRIQLELAERFSPKARSGIEMDIHQTIIRQLDFELGAFLDEKIAAYAHKSVQPLSQEVSQHKKIIWNFWYQGDFTDIDMVNMCYKHLKESVADDVQIITLSKENLAQYLELPPHIVQKYAAGIIRHSHFANIVRTGLISQYGGVWLDMTCYVDGDITYAFDKEFWSIRHGIKGGLVADGKWTTFALGGQPGCFVTTMVYELLCEYWRIHDVAITYLFFDYSFALLYKKSLRARKLIDDIVPNNFHVRELVKNLNQPYSSELYQSMVQDTQIFKLTYKQAFKEMENGTSTLYHWLLQREN